MEVVGPENAQYCVSREALVEIILSIKEAKEEAKRMQEEEALVLQLHSKMMIEVAASEVSLAKEASTQMLEQLQEKSAIAFDKARRGHTAY